ASNAFILNIKDSRHPILLYKSFGVPIVLSTDDAGILRTTLTEQYVLLAKKYTAFSYSDIKNIVYNGIRYSFIEDENVKKKLLKNLDERFRVFESTFYMEN
ncbi:MAG: adenosine deaminase, partial [Chitinophagaceae bacterium]